MLAATLAINATWGVEMATRKEETTGRPRLEWTYNQFTLAEITGFSVNSIEQHRARKKFNPNSLESVLIWAARYARDDLRWKMIESALRREDHGPMRRVAKKKKTAV